MSTFDPKERTEAIWSTEASAALGLSSRKTPAQLWAEKRGLAQEADQSDNIPARLGLACQRGVMQLHVEDTGDQLIPLDDVSLRREVSGVPVGSHYDAWNKTAKRLHEVKFFALHRLNEFGTPGSDVVPMDVLVQCLHEMLVWNADDTGYGKAEACEINVVFGNVQRAIFVIPYDLAAIEKLVQREAEFWALVKSETPPIPQSPEDARRIWAKSDGSEKIASQQTMQACQALSGLKKQIKQLDAQAEEMELFVQRAMETASTLKSPEGRVLATWNSTSTERVDIKRLRSEMPQVAELFLTTTESRRFLTKG